METVVCNTSPLIFLAKLGRLNLLKDVYGKVLVPDIVLKEALVAADLHADALEIRAALENGFLSVAKTESNAGENVLQGLGLHEGELAVLKVAKKQGVKIVLLDDFAAIKAAKYLGLEPQSTPFGGLTADHCQPPGNVV